MSFWAKKGPDITFGSSLSVFIHTHYYKLLDVLSKVQAMIALLQRVTSASVVVDSNCIAAINTGLLVLLGVQKGDAHNQADKLLEKILSYRIFPDGDGKMNLGLVEAGGGLIIVPQFTLAADTRKGLRPGFSTAASPDDARRMYEHMIEKAAARVNDFGTGQFGADMKVQLVNDGPATFWLEVPPNLS